MKLLLLRFVFAWMNLASYFERVSVFAQRLGVGMAYFLLGHIHYRWLFVLPHMYRALGMCGRSLKLRAKVAQANRQCLLQDGLKLDYIGLTQRRKWLVMAATHGRNAQVLKEMAACTEQLNAVVEPLHQQGQTVMLAPLHMVSDVLATMVGAGVYPGKATVIASFGDHVHSTEELVQGGLNLEYCSIHDPSQVIAGNLLPSLMSAARGERNIILFPDITPDFTLAAYQGQTSKLACQLFQRPAKLHNGIVRLSRAIAAQVVFYHLYYEQGVKIKIHPPLTAKQLKDQMPKIIEQSIKKHADDWMLWHAHSLYFMNQ
jgi:hypothetical protein